VTPTEMLERLDPLTGLDTAGAIIVLGLVLASLTALGLDGVFGVARRISTREDRRKAQHVAVMREIIADWNADALPDGSAISEHNKPD